MTISDNLWSSYFDVIRYHAKGVDPNLFTPDSHDGFEILHVRSGAGHVIINNQLYELSPSTIFFINGRLFHYSNPLVVEEYERNGLHMDQSCLISLLETFGQQELLNPFLQETSKQICIHLSARANEQIDRLFLQISEEYRHKRQGYVLAIAAMFVQIMLLAFRDKPRADPHELPNNAAYAHVTHIMGYIQQNLNCFSLDELAREAYLNKYYLCHIFKEITGLTIQKYLLKKRVESAQTMLSSTDKPISKIAMDLGFGSFSVFSRNFHAMVGCTPREYRKSTRNRPHLAGE